MSGYASKFKQARKWVFRNNVTREYPAEQSGVGGLLDDASGFLLGSDVGEVMAGEYRLLIEEVLLKLLQNAEQGTQITMTLKKRLSRFVIILESRGEPIRLEREHEEDFGGMIIEEYRDYLNFTYRDGVNIVEFSKSAPVVSHYIRNFLALVAAVLAAVILTAIFPADRVAELCDSICRPMLKFFVNFLETLAMPVVFVTIILFVIHLRLRFNRKNRLYRLLFRYLFSTVVCIAISVAVFWVTKQCGLYPTDPALAIEEQELFGSSLSEIIQNLAPDNILAPFLTSSPLPLIITAYILGLAVVRTNTGRVMRLQSGLNSLKGLFSTALQLVYDIFPLFVFLCELDAAVYFIAGKSYEYVIPYRLLLYSAVPFLLTIVYYHIRLRVSGISVREFYRDYGEILRRNFLIGSDKDAMPYNLRKLKTKFAVPSRSLREQLNLGIVSNMDGTCQMVMASVLIMSFYVGGDLSGTEILLLAGVVISLALGAPNENGGYLLSMTVLMPFLGISDVMFSDAVIVEVFFGSLYSALNAVGDIVTLAIFNKKYRKS